MNRPSPRSALRGRPCAVLLAVLASVGLVAACGLPERPVADAGVTGPEWQVVPRSGAGVASPSAQSRLTAITVDEHQDYDRLVVRFYGDRPGYRVAYDDQDASVLTITLNDARSPGSHPASDLPAIREVHRPSAEGGAVVTRVTLNAAQLPFRVGLAPSSFYVDVAHPSAQ